MNSRHSKRQNSKKVLGLSEDGDAGVLLSVFLSISEKEAIELSFAYEKTSGYTIILDVIVLEALTCAD